MRRVSRRTVARLPWLLVVLALVVGVSGAVSAQDHRVTRHRAAPPAAVAFPTATPTPAIRVAALTHRVPPHLLIVSTHPLTPTRVRELVTATGARASLVVSAGRATIGAGHTTALAVDPGTFRAWTPPGTAESDPVWQSVAAGEGAVAHVVGRAFDVPLGGSVTARVARPVALHVGSFATTALPGIGLVVNTRRGAGLGLVPGTGLLLSIPQRESEASAVIARRHLGPGMTVGVVQYRPSKARLGGWVVPAVGRVTSGFGPRLHPLKHVVLFHDGIDIGAPLGAPVYAMSDGFVLYAGPASGFGSEIVLSHRGGVTTVYGHVSRILVASGPVTAGEPIALVGNEGESTGPHLHAEVRVNDQPVDPIAWLRAHGVRL